MSDVKKHMEFQKANRVVSRDAFFDEMDDKTETVKRVVEGRLADDVRKRVGAGPEVPVVVTEVEQQGWVSDITATMHYIMTVECNRVERKFETYSAHSNFAALLRWLNEDPATNWKTPSKER